MNAEERWVGVEDIAAHLNVFKDSLFWWTDRKGFPAHKVLRLLLFKLSEVDALIRRGGEGQMDESKEDQSA